jgi:hypothetical protein
MDIGKIVNLVFGLLPQNPLLGPPLPAMFNITWQEPKPKEEKQPFEILRPAPPQVFE